MIDRSVCLFCSAYNMPSFEAGAQLLSSLSGYAYTKRTWKKEVFELFMDPLFFTMDASCASKLVHLLIEKIWDDNADLRLQWIQLLKSDVVLKLISVN